MSRHHRLVAATLSVLCLGELACAALGFAVVAAIWVAFLLFVAGQLTPPHVG